MKVTIGINGIKIGNKKETKTSRIKSQEKVARQLISSSRHNEEWKEIYYNDTLYYVSDKGRIMSRFGKVLSTPANNKGYSIFKGTTVHRIVAYAFGLLKELKYDYQNEVDHINGDKSDNSLSNLQILSHKDNIKKRDTHGEGKHHSVNCYTLDGTYVRSFYSIKKAARTLGLQSSNICNVLKGKLPHTGGYKFD